MNVWTRWLRQPQSVLLRRIFFQIHLWVGVGLGLYVLMISVTGSLLVYRRDLAAALTTKPVTPAEHRLTADELKAVVQRAYPGFDLQEVYTPSVRGRRVPDQAVQVQLRRDDQTIARFFDPYTGADLGAMKLSLINSILWLADLHDDLLGGDTGRWINGLGAILATILTLTGIILWWPGNRNWRNSLTIVGFWMFSFVLLWGVSGIYLCFPKPFNATVDFFEPLAEGGLQNRVGDTILFWLAALHFGRFSGLTVKVIWTVLGLAPAVLVITGGLMWWHRTRKKQQSLQVNVAPETTQETQMSSALGSKPGPVL
jgi:uncharacterized iron-regulated membrane protein